VLHEQYSEALLAYKNLIASDDDAALLWAELAYVHCRLGEYGPAVRAANRALELDPDFAEAHATLGLALHKGGSSRSRARQALKRAVKLDPGLATARCSLGCLYFEKGELELARTELSSAVGLDANLPEAVFNLALVYDRLAADKRGGGADERREARRYYRRFLELADGPPLLREHAREAIQRLDAALGAEGPVDEQ
jgi:Flp pilus assembly protein TadD